ncbi:MAG: ABC transporter permease [Candidatus Bathyarchaeota archaeon]|nr:ABC transporter permease [Candidatus Bathyarchaeota archaeon]MDH5746970.1 ABC transporter permease [Candidatus Bathyarchaeota archaeon]
MSETSFPVNDLLRRKLQTGLTVASLTLCVALTVFLLLFGENIGFEISQVAEGKLTSGFSIIFSQFITFIGLLIVVTGAVIVSFMVFVMMSQRVKDIGLMRATGCPNDLIFGYFMTELLIVTFVSCFLGVVFGILADYASISLFSFTGFQILQKPVNFWLILLIFVLFFVLAVIFGVKPILDVTKVEPAKAISPTYHYGLSKEPGFRVISKSSFTVKIALRSLFRRKSATIRIILCLATVFTLVTVAIAGGIIADQTTKSWVEKAIGRDMILIAHKNMSDQYKLLLSKFHGAKEDLQFNYTEQEYLVPESLLNQLKTISSIDVDARLVVEGHVREVPGEIIDSETATIISVGDDREGESLIVGVEPEKVLSEWFVEGEPLKESETLEAVVGESLAQKMFSKPLNQYLMVFDRIFNVTGVCMDPINNGNVTYVPLDVLQNVTGILKPNIVMVRVDSVNRAEVLEQIRTTVDGVDSEFRVFELNEALEENVGFLGYVWSTLMFLPLFSLIAASLCLIGYVVLAIAEQSRELGVLRALGIKPKTVTKTVSEQSFIVLLSSFVAGVPIGIILTLLILVPEPVVTSHTILEIAGWLLVALVVMFVSSLYPAVKFARKPILEIMNKP